MIHILLKHTRSACNFIVDHNVSFVDHMPKIRKLAGTLSLNTKGL